MQIASSVSAFRLFFISKYRLDGYFAVICNRYVLHADLSTDHPCMYGVSCFSLIYLLSAGFSPICGVLIDLYGRHVLWITISILLSGVAHVILALTFLTPYLPMVRDIACAERITILYHKLLNQRVELYPASCQYCHT